jgi:superfamily II DNA/RNA helicase
LPLLQVSAMLQDRGVPNLVYHKNLPAADQAAALAAMRQPLPSAVGNGDAGDAADASNSSSGNLLLVSTDAAARGIDLPLVTHVIQADFASNAVEFLHRVGRTARAGRAGKVTSLYGRADTVLAEALRRYVREGRPVEECFSRNRSFSRKVKRYGGFVPRGQEGPQRGASDGEE